MSVKILSVDDSRLVRIQVKKALSIFDVEILEAENGKIGLELARKEHPELILLDITMPVMTGDVMLVELRKDPDVGKTPVIMLSADLNRETMLRMARSGSNDYIPKPFASKILIEKVQKLLARTLDNASQAIVEKKQNEVKAESGSSNKHVYFIPENDHLTISFPNFDFETVREINREFYLPIVEAVRNNIFDIFIDLTRMRQIDVSLAATIFAIDEECTRRKARCHILIPEPLHSLLRFYPGCEYLNLYTPPPTAETES